MAGRPGLSCEVSRQAAAVHVIATGEFDHRSRELFDRTVHAALAGGPPSIVLDLTGVTFLSSEGMSALVSATDLARETGSTLEITPSRFVLRRLEFVGLTQILNLSSPPR